MTANTAGLAIIQNLTNSYANLTNIIPLTLMQVTVQFALIKTNELSNTGILTISGVLIMYWSDPRIGWSCNLANCVNIPASLIWNPNIRIINCPDSVSIVTPDASGIAYVFCDSSVTLILQRQIRSTCSVNLNSFPFDSQTCSIMFISYDRGPFQAGLTFGANTSTNSVDLTYYEETGEFTLSNATVLAPAPDICAINYCFSSFQLLLTYSRRSSYYVLNMITPAILLTMVIAFAFIIPSENSVKVTMTCSLMVSLYVLQQNVSRLLPAGASSSMCALGTMASLILGCFAMVGTICNVILRMTKPNIASLTGCLRKLSWVRCACCAPNGAEVSSARSSNPNAVGCVDGKTEETPIMTLKAFAKSDDDNYQNQTQTVEQKSMLTEALLARLVAISEEELNRSKRKVDSRQASKVVESNLRILDAIMNFLMFLGYLIAAIVCTLILQLQI